MSNVERRAIGDVISVRRAAANTSVTAGGGGDNAAVTGVVIDRAALGWPLSLVIAIPFTATLGAAETLSLAFTLQHDSVVGFSGPTTLQSATAAVAATGGAGGSTEAGCFEVKADLSGAKRFVRVNFTPDLSRANTDTAALSAVLVFGGAERLPQ